MCELKGRRGSPRLCSRTFNVVCQSCEDSVSSIPAVDIAGRVVTVHGKQFILAPCCASIQEYNGSGSDLSIQEFLRRAVCQHGAKLQIIENGSKRTRPQCAVCEGFALPKGHEIVDHLSGRMTVVFLCHKHTPPDEWLKYVANKKDFDQACVSWERRMRMMHKKGF